MSRFKLQEKTITVRGEEIVIRELTHSERLQIARTPTDDKLGAASLLISMGIVSPPIKREEVDQEPGDVMKMIGDEIMALSNIGKEEKKA